MQVRVANITDDMSDNERILELLLCAKDNFNGFASNHRGANEKIKLAFYFSAESNIADALAYARKTVGEE